MSNDFEAGRGRGVCCGGWKQGGAGGSLDSLQGLERPTQLPGWPEAPVSPEQHPIVPRPCPLQTRCFNLNICTMEDFRQSQAN